MPHQAEPGARTLPGIAALTVGFCRSRLFRTLSVRACAGAAQGRRKATRSLKSKHRTALAMAVYGAVRRDLLQAFNSLTAISRTLCAGLRGRGAGAPEALIALHQSNAVPWQWQYMMPSGEIYCGLDISLTVVSARAIISVIARPPIRHSRTRLRCHRLRRKSSGLKPKLRPPPHPPIA